MQRISIDPFIVPGWAIASIATPYSSTGQIYNAHVNTYTTRLNLESN